MSTNEAEQRWAKELMEMDGAEVQPCHICTSVWKRSAMERGAEIAVLRTRVARLEEALHKIKDAPAQSLWMDSRDDAADQMVDIATEAINGT